MTTVPRSLSASAFGTLVLIAFLMGANHVAARVAFNNGVDVATAVMARSAATAAVLALLLWLMRVPLALKPKHRKALPAIGLLVAMQSLCLYSAVARLPVALALLAFNTYPLFTALWSALVYRQPPQRRVLWAMPVMLFGLALALDVLGATSGLGAAGQWGRIGEGVAYALAAAAIFGLALVLTQHEAGDLDGRVRTFSTMLQVGLLAAAMGAIQGGYQWPQAPAGWVGAGSIEPALRHGFHDHVHRIAAPGRGGQFSHHECRAHLCAGAGLGLAGAAHCSRSSGVAGWWLWAQSCG